MGESCLTCVYHMRPVRRVTADAVIYSLLAGIFIPSVLIVRDALHEMCLCSIIDNRLSVVLS